MISNPAFWVALSFLLFTALIYKKAAIFITHALDERSAKIKSELDAASTLREEAEAILADYQRKQTSYLKEVEAMLKKARQDADSLRAQAESDLKATLEARMQQALEKIEQEESRAISDVRNHVVDIALASARAELADRVSAMPPQDLLKLALADPGRKIH